MRRRVTTPEALGRALRDERRRRDWSQSELARRASSTQAGVSNFERGLGNPTIMTILAFAAALELELVVKTLDPGDSVFPWDNE